MKMSEGRAPGFSWGLLLVASGDPHQFFLSVEGDSRAV